MEPWQGLDVEEQDLESFVKRYNSATTLIPGPTGNVQVAMINRDKEHAQSIQQFARDIASATYERDFKSNPWLWAEQFIKFHGIPSVIILDVSILLANESHLAEKVVLCRATEGRKNWKCNPVSKLQMHKHSSICAMHCQTM